MHVHMRIYDRSKSQYAKINNTYACTYICVLIKTMIDHWKPSYSSFILADRTAATAPAVINCHDLDELQFTTHQTQTIEKSYVSSFTTTQRRSQFDYLHQHISLRRKQKSQDRVLTFYRS